MTIKQFRLSFNKLKQEVQCAVSLVSPDDLLLRQNLLYGLLRSSEERVEESNSTTLKQHDQLLLMG